MDFPANLYPLSVSSVVSTPTGIRVVLPYRAISFTSGQSLVTPLGQVVNAAVSANLSTVGIKQFTLSTSPGLSVAVSGELMLPGPMASEFTASGFHENGINLGLEQPFVVAQNDAGNLQQNGAYQYVAVAEVTDENGERVFSIPSPPLNVTLTGPNTQVQIGGRVPQPFDGNGVPISAHFGTTNRRLLTLSIYRTSYVGGVPTTQHYKLTNDLNVNGLAPVSTINTSGFSFPDEFTWYYSDNNPDVNVVSNEILYTDKGFLPRFPAPPNRGGAFWKDRPWVIGYDGAVWMGGEKTEGDAAWFFPGYRFIIPSTETAVSLAKMDDYLLVLCSGGRNFYIPATTFPNAAGKNGTLPNVVEMPFTNGCTGFSETLGEGVVYSSTAGGVWLVTRDVKNGWISQPIQDSLATLPISSIVVDKRQRLHVTAQTGFIYVYDQVVQTWYTWLLPTARAYLMTILDGEAAFQDDEHVWLAGPTLFADNLAGTKHGTPWDVTFASLNFANVRGLKSVWEMQLVGDYKGEHHLNAILSYPDDQPDEPTTFPAPDASPFTPDPTLPYLLAINPAIEQASSYGLRVFVDFDGIDDPGNSSELELVSCEVGMDPIGVNKFNDFRRIPGR
jgi:hypothetical protein